ncbi:hypothetical protein [Leptospira brenneri]|uniref:hypothetical protein n=1 Tax=Leptospira brenneri TaxID=2023182 RepID=UPI000C296832|nr:hypothetical protein [Leptospira brenneri]PJZ43685.1 hypothetical protein CH361_19095 [Leptospira brenneri]
MNKDTNLIDTKIRPDRESLTPITPLPWYDPQTDNATVQILNRIMNKWNTCMGTTYLAVIKWTGLVLGINTYAEWSEKDYYKKLGEFVKKDLDITTSAFHNKLFNSLFSGKASVIQVPFSLEVLKEHIKITKCPAAISIDVRQVFNPKAKDVMGHIILPVAQCNNGLTAHDPRGKWDTNYKDLQGANCFFSNALLEQIARKEFMNLFSIGEVK